MPQIKVNLYKLNYAGQPAFLPQLLTDIKADPLSQRIKRIGYNDIRLEHILEPNSVDNPTPYWLLDFVKVRMEHGPGKVGISTPIQGFALANNEGFGEETAVLFDPVKDYILVQYNHHGVRGSSVDRYLNEYDHTATQKLSLDIKLDTTSEAKLAAKQFVTKLTVKIAPDQMTASHRHRNVSLKRAIELNNAQHGNTVEFTLSASRGRSLSTGPINRMLDTLRSWRVADAQDGVQALEQFQVEAKEDLADRAEKIDMLLPTLEAKISGIVLGQDRRYTMRSRFDALLRARTGWSQIIG